MNIAKYYRGIVLVGAVALALVVMMAVASARVDMFRVTEAAIEARPMSYAGACPGVIKFKGKITTDGPGTVKYTFTRSDGATGPVLRLDFASGGTQEVETDWTLGDAVALPHYEGWQTIRILSPNELESNRAKFVLDCQNGNTTESKTKAKNSAPNSRQISFSVDPSLQPQIKTLPSIEGNKHERRVASVAQGKDTQADFVEDELLVVSDDQGVLQKVAERYNGKVLTMVDFKKTQLNVPSAYLLHVDVTNADLTNLATNVELSAKEGGGPHRVSSEAGLKLIAAAAELNASGLPVSINFLLYPRDIASGSTAEATTGLSGGWNPNACAFAYMDQGSQQNIGICAAWRELQRSGRFSNRVRIAVLDAGFERDTDLAADSAFMGLPGGLGLPGSGGSPFHGANVTDTLMAIPDNRFGSAGAAGVIAQPLMIDRTVDLLGFISALDRAAAANAKIVNMSFGATLPAALAVVPGGLLNALTNSLRLRGMLLFAAAPNVGTLDIDALDGISGTAITWEAAWDMPCENDDVICVGGMGDGMRTRDSGSAFGSRFGLQPTSIDIFGPFWTWVSDDPGDRAAGTLPAGVTSGAKKVAGNSFATPTVAGIAGLIWAADPSLSADRVESILLETGQRATAPTDVPLRPNALAAVCRALGGCAPVSGPGPDASANFRVTINGFTCTHRTRDDLFQLDGVDDEIFVMADVSLYDRRTNRNQPMARSLVMGDTNRQPGRIRAGSGFSVFGANGGFKEGDSFPAGVTPWIRTIAPTSDRPPLLVWSGALIRDDNALVVIPSLWESDNDTRMLDVQWISSIASTFSTIGPEVGVMIARRAGHTPTAELKLTLRRLFDSVRINEGNDPKDRPVGMDDRGEQLGYMPQPLVLTFDAADRLSRTDFGLGPGILPLTFTDQSDFEGNYTLYVQVERVP